MDRLQIPKVDSIQSTVQKLKNGELKVVDLVMQHIALAKEIQEKTNAFITIFDGETNTDQYNPIEKAKELDQKIANGQIEDLSLLGIPFTAKDLYLVENTLTTFGSQYMKDFIAPYTGTVIQKCLDKGAILIAKCNCDPWGFGGSGENSGFGAAKNPYDLARTPGGSSSGSAAAMAAGVGFFSLGTDTGGSVRQPAGFTRLYGFKPTYGKNSRFGIGVMGSSFDTPGFFTRHVEDTNLLQTIMQGKDKKDPTTKNFEEPNINSTKTIGILKEFFADGLDSQIRQKIEEKIEQFKTQGYEVKEISIPEAKYSLAIYYVLVPAEISSNRARYDGVRFGPKVDEDYETNLIKGRSEYMEEEVKRRILIGTYVLSAGYSDRFYKKASIVRQNLKDKFSEAFQQVDFLIGPTSPTTAFKLGEKAEDPVQMYLSDIYTVTANLVGVPSLSIPVGEDENGLPIGMQIMAPWGEETSIFTLAGLRLR